MPEKTHNENESEEDLGPSKSALKRQMHALQELGESLVTLNESQLQKIPIESEALLEAITEFRLIGSNSAKKRHLQRIGKLMRYIDPEPIERALKAMDQTHQNQKSAFHDLEALRDDMLAAGNGGAELAMEKWPEADRQHLRQLIMQHQREIAKNKPPAASRKLFRYLRELQEDYGASD
ncbi:MAG: ribosome-associated protein [Halioglobus sp.]|jgi:ribosome-associated protein